MFKRIIKKLKYKHQLGLEPSNQIIVNPNAKCSKTVREEITRILYQNSTDDSECMRIEFNKIQIIIDEIMLHLV